MGTVFVTLTNGDSRLFIVLYRCQCHLRSEATSKALKHLLTVLRRVPAPVNSLRPEPGLGHRPWLRAAVVPPAARVRPGLVELPVAQHRQSFLEAGVAGYNKIWKEIITNRSVDKWKPVSWFLWSQKLEEIDTWRSKRSALDIHGRSDENQLGMSSDWTHQARIKRK